MREAIISVILDAGEITFYDLLDEIEDKFDSRGEMRRTRRETKVSRHQPGRALHHRARAEIETRMIRLTRFH
jgi:hypothetical protein